MATGDGEEVLSEPVDVAGSDGEGVADAVAGALSGIGHALLAKLGVATNAAPSPPAKTSDVPTLPEKTVQGYANGVAFDLRVVLVYGKWVEKSTAYDYLLMREAAKKDGIAVGINVGFRPNEVQQALYRERMNPDGSLTPLGVKYGRAAKPGYSNHQQGIALDLLVGMTVADRAVGRFTAVFLWLQRNAATYGFDNTEVPAEPWHWRHKAKTIVGPGAGDKDYLQSLVSNAATAAALGQSGGKTDGETFLNRAAHALTSAQQRSLEMMQTGRSALYANMGRFAVLRGAEMLGVAGEYAQRSAEMPQTPPTITKEASKAIGFNFTTGTWGDGRSH